MPDNPDTTIEEYDIVVVGCGMAGLCSGIRASELGNSVAILEIAPKEKRGGQTQFTDLIRVPSADINLEDYGYEFDTEYSTTDFYRDVMKVTKGRADQDLTQTLVDNTGETIEWLTDRGVEWENTGIPAEHWLATVVQHKSTGSDTVDQMVEIAEKLGVDFYYETKATDLHRDEDLKISGISALKESNQVYFDCKSVVIASGGFESNVEKRSRYLGTDYDTIVVRGSRYNTGEPIEQAIDIDAQSEGHWSGAHVTIIDAGSPEIEGGDTKVYGYPYSLLVNHNGERFVDEGRDMQTFTYAEYGREVFKQPDKEAFVIFDSKLKDHVYSTGPTSPIKGGSIEELANRLGIDNIEQTMETVETFNEGCDPDEFIPTELDGNNTSGVTPEKTNWAIPLDEPPYYGFPVTAGITFTFGGLKIDTNAQVQNTRDQPIPGLYASGSCTGGVFYYNYPSGTALAQAAVYGKIAGESANTYLDQT